MADTDYLEILKAMQQLPFAMGKKAMLAVLSGNANNDVVRRNRLDKEPCFGCLEGYTTDELDAMFSRLLINNLMEKTVSGRYFKVFTLTEKGKEELRNPTLHEKKFSARFESSEITPAEKKLFSAFNFFLSKYNDEQKKAIVCTSDSILCVAGAGSGKTTVLTKRIEFLTRFCGVSREKILAITFTRKARQEMESRLRGLVQVETFNSFCEKLLMKHSELLYGKPVRVLRYRDRMRLLHHALKKLNLDMSALNRYFKKRRDVTQEQMPRLFLNDCFHILDYYANENREFEDFSQGDANAKLVYNICRSMRQEMKEVGLRDYSDQLQDAIKLFKKHPELIPRYEHVLVDEYQDVNVSQKLLLDMLRPRNLFVVGDPRQSIFGWRGSRIQFILDYAHEAETIVLKKNYRSDEKIVQAINTSIKRLALPDLETDATGGSVNLHTFKSEDDEISFIAEKILSASTRRKDIFVLTRTNRQLQSASQVFHAKGIAHVLRHEEKLAEAQADEITLSTVHAIKGMEADSVFVLGCTAQYFPCIASDHPVMELVKTSQHDREEEELRLFYVAMSRARKELHLTYSGTPTRFLNPELKKVLGVSYDSKLYNTQGSQGKLFQKLKEWRTNHSRKAGIPPYMIFPDKTLLALVEKRPEDVAELHTVNGVGPVKAEKYGEELLSIIHSNP